MIQRSSGKLGDSLETELFKGEIILQCDLKIQPVLDWDSERNPDDTTTASEPRSMVDPAHGSTNNGGSEAKALGRPPERAHEAEVDLDSEPRELIISQRPHEATSTSEAEHSDTGAREAHMTKEVKPKTHSELVKALRARQGGQQGRWCSLCWFREPREANTKANTPTLHRRRRRRRAVQSGRACCARTRGLLADASEPRAKP